jgi:hypothetical protein
VTAAVASGDKTTQVIATGVLVRALAWLGNEAEARQVIPEAIDLAEGLANPTITVSAYINVTEALVLLGSSSEAASTLERAFPYAEAGGSIVASSTYTLYGLVVDDLTKAVWAVRESLRIAKDQLSGDHQLNPLVGAAHVLMRAGKQHAAARLLGVNEHGRPELSWPGIVAGPTPGGTLILRRHDPLKSELARTMDAAALEEELQNGARLSVAEALQLADDLLAEIAE